MSYIQVRLSRLFYNANIVTVAWLRYLNFFIGVILLPLQLRRLMYSLSAELVGIPQFRPLNYSHGLERLQFPLSHTVANICLFPPLFFFNALYYTDVVSSLSVLYVYHFCRQKQRLRVLLAGLASLWFRQTNIFWVSIFMGGLDLTTSLHMPGGYVEHPTEPTIGEVAGKSWQNGHLYDRYASEAYAAGLSLIISESTLLIVNNIDYFESVLSTILVAASNPQKVVLILWPYLSLLAAFGAFVAWNGGVVLGKLI